MTKGIKNYSPIKLNPSSSKQNSARISQKMEDAAIIISVDSPMDRINLCPCLLRKVSGRKSAMAFGITDTAHMVSDVNSAMNKFSGILKLR